MASPRPGTDSALGLAIAVTLGLSAAAWIIWMLAGRRRWMNLGSLVVMGAAGGVLAGLSPNSPAVAAPSSLLILSAPSSPSHLCSSSRFGLTPDPDTPVVLMDLNMPRCDGVEATRRIRASHPQTQVVVLTTYSDDESIIGALQAGALGYLTKDATRAEIGRAVLAAAAGQAVLDPEVQQRLLSAAVRAPAATRQPRRPRHR